MGKMTAKTFVEKALDIAKNYKTLYVMGCFGAPLVGTQVDRYCKNHSYNKKSSRTKMIKAAGNQTPPVYGFDCVCLIKGILWGWSGKADRIYGGAAYATNGVPDIGANTMIGYCTGVSSKNWADMVPGEAVWCSGHIGIYIGNGLAIECTPSWKNCVQITAVGNIGSKAGYNTRTWTKHGKLPWVDYSENIDNKTENKKIEKGSKVRIRSGAKTYTGGNLASFVYKTTYTVIEVVGSRVVIGLNGVVTAAVNAKDITLL